MKIDNVVAFLKEECGLKIIDEELDVNLEIPHIAYVEVKKKDSRPLLFTNPVDRKENRKFDIPVLMNIFSNFETTKKILGKDPDKIGSEIEELLHLKPPRSFSEKFSLLMKLFSLKNVFPKRIEGKGTCQEIELKSDLDLLPILKTWPDDGGKFITMGQVYTVSLDGKQQNLGMYRLQKHSSTRLGMHWQIHKDGAHFFHEYKKAKKKMPVTVAVGGDPLYIWCGQAPLPAGVFELLLYGFIRGENPRLVKSLTNDIYIPADVDIVIEGYVDPEDFEIEGPFGDHTGYYTLKEPFPVMEVTKITSKENPVFQATVVGKPPLEDKYMGWATERIFLPLLKTTAPDLIDYHMPENGVFHNLILANMKCRYPGHAKQFMHAFWGVGQMSFVKHAIFMGEDAPDLTSYDDVATYVLDRIDKDSVFVSEGVVDHLDHSSCRQFVGGKLGIDATGDPIESLSAEILDDEELLKRFKELDQDVISLRQYKKETKNPVCIISYRKKRPLKFLFEKAKALQNHIKILVVVDEENDLDNPYMLVWRVVNNIDAKRDLLFEPFFMLDATNKREIDGFEREWPDDVRCDPQTLKNLKDRGLLEIDEDFEKRFML